MIVDNEEFYEQEKPLSLKDVRYLIVILREVLLGVEFVIKHAMFLGQIMTSVISINVLKLNLVTHLYMGVATRIARGYHLYISDWQY